MKKVYICSPLSGDIKHNMEKAVSYCKEAFKAGYLPVAPHIYFPQFADDNDPEQRKICMKAGLDLLSDCDELWVYGEPSKGMMEEIAEARRMGVEVIGEHKNRAIQRQLSKL